MRPMGLGGMEKYSICGTGGLVAYAILWKQCGGFPQIGVTPSHHPFFHGIFHWNHHSGTPIPGNPHMKQWWMRIIFAWLPEDVKNLLNSTGLDRRERARQSRRAWPMQPTGPSISAARWVSRSTNQKELPSGKYTATVENHDLFSIGKSTINGMWIKDPNHRSVVAVVALFRWDFFEVLHVVRNPVCGTLQLRTRSWFWRFTLILTAGSWWPWVSWTSRKCPSFYNSDITEWLTPSRRGKLLSQWLVLTTYSPHHLQKVAFEASFSPRISLPKIDGEWTCLQYLIDAENSLASREANIAVYPRHPRARYGWMSKVASFITPPRNLTSMDWFKGKFTGKPHIS